MSRQKHLVTLIYLLIIGLGDPSGCDSQNIAAMVDKLKELCHVNAFLIVFNGQSPRLDEPLRAMLNIFADIFGKGFFSNVILIFTRWEHDDKSERKRQSTGTHCTTSCFKLLLLTERFSCKKWTY